MNSAKYDFKSVNDYTDFSNLIGVKTRTFTYLLYKIEINNCYTSFEIPKKDGTKRQIAAPNKALKNLLRKLSYILYEKQKEIWKQKDLLPNISHGFEREKSIITNAKVHRNKRYILNVDLEDFFNSIHFGRVRGYFRKNKNFEMTEFASKIMAQLVCYNGSLPQGAPTSPVISNLICQILDFRILSLAKAFKLDYTRYADDLTFSTNNKYFEESNPLFLEKLKELITHSGFRINDKKTRLIYKNSHQEVTGLTVNSRINTSITYHKKARAMVHSLYTKGEFKINGEKGKLSQLEGMLSFIDIADLSNSISDDFNKREKVYRDFIFYKEFLNPQMPVILTEGKTDIKYLKAALEKYYKDYPDLITKKISGKFEYKIHLLKRKQKYKRFFNLQKDGADTLNIVYNHFAGGKNQENFHTKLKNHDSIKINPVIFMFDNEVDTEGKVAKPISKFKGFKKIEKDEVKLKSFLEDNKIKLLDNCNLYLLTNQLVKGKKECEIEDLFPDVVLLHKINGKQFTRKDKYDTEKFYGKDIFSNYIYSNYRNIDMSEFKCVLDNIVSIIQSQKG